MPTDEQDRLVSMSDLLAGAGYVAPEENIPGTRSSFGIRQSTGRVGDAQCYLCDGKYAPNPSQPPYCHECTIGLAAFMNTIHDAYRGGSIHRLHLITQATAKSLNTLLYFKSLGANTEAIRNLLKELSMDPSRAQ